MTSKDDFDNFDDTPEGDLPDLDGGAEGGVTPRAGGKKALIIGGSIVAIVAAGFVGLQLMSGSNETSPAPAPSVTAEASVTDAAAPSAPSSANNMATAPAPTGGMGLAMPEPIAATDTAADGSVPMLDMPGGQNDAPAADAVVADNNIVAPVNPALATEAVPPAGIPDAGAAIDQMPVAEESQNPIATAADTAAAAAPEATPETTPAPAADIAMTDAVLPPANDETSKEAMPVVTLPTEGATPAATPATVSGTVPDTAPVAVSADVAAKLAALETLLSDIKANAVTRSDIATIESRLSALEAGGRVSGSAVEKPATKKTTVKTVKKAAVKKPAAKAATVAKTAAPRWVLKSARPGSALIAAEGQDDLRPIAVGDTVSGIGKVTMIEQAASGRWVVVGTGGRITQ